MAQTTLEQGRRRRIEDQKVRLVSGRKPPDPIADLRAATRSVTRGIRWRAGDFALIDNNRVLHGRNQTTDPARQIVMLSSYSSRFDLASPRP